MTPYYADDWLTILEGDCREVMATMEPESVHCVVTSPPYWGLRDYGTATWIGGDEGCDHLGPPMRTNNKPSDSQATFHGGTNRSTEPWKDGTCGKCGAIREDSQLGLEPTPEAYVENMVGVFREVRRVLRADGTVWLNLGDSYAAGPKGNPGDQGDSIGRSRPGVQAERDRGGFDKTKIPGLKPKDLVGIPWRVAFALQADGWYLRSDIIWSKPNPMPESVTDRPTKAHEYLFLLSKSPRYYYDADAVREPHMPLTQAVHNYHTPIKDRGDQRQFRKHGLHDFRNELGRNLRSVWTVATQPYPGAHFATFPEKLVEPCILAGTSAKGVCPECGAPWVREVERGFIPHQATYAKSGGAAVDAWTGGGGVPGWSTSTTTGWHRSCDHEGEPVPATVLDPFAGSGTVGRVAARLSRRAVLIDLNAAYLGQAMKRNDAIPLGLETA